MSSIFYFFVQEFLEKLIRINADMNCEQFVLRVDKYYILYRSSTNFCVYFILANFASRLMVAKIKSQNLVIRRSHADQVHVRSQNKITKFFK